MPTITLSDVFILVALLVQLLLILAVPRLPFRTHRALGFLALAVGIAVCGWLAVSAGGHIRYAQWRAAAQSAFELYVLGSASWLAWKATKPF